MVIVVITGHLVMGTHARRIGDFCRNCRDEEKDKTVIHLLGTCPALCQWRKRRFGAYYMDTTYYLEKLLSIYITEV